MFDITLCLQITKRNMRAKPLAGRAWKESFPSMNHASPKYLVVKVVRVASASLLYPIMMLRLLLQATEEAT
jgi:hypothetical protein